MEAVNFSSMAIKDRDGGHDSTIKCDQNPAHDDEPVDKLLKVNSTRSFYFAKYRIYQNHELETKIHHAEEEMKNIDQTCKLIRDTILQKKLKNGYRTPLESLLWSYGAREDDRYKKVINEKKTKIDYRRRDRNGELRAIFDTSRKKGDDTCSSEKELNNRVCGLHFRTRCGKTTFVEEKHLLRDIQQLEETRPGIVVNDALKQKRFNESMDRVGQPINPARFSCRYSRKLKNLKDIDLDKLKREKQVFSARVKNAEEAWKAMSNDLPSLELKLAGTIKKRTAKEKLLVKLKKRWNEEKLNYNQQYYNNYKSLILSARKLAGKKNITALEELSYKEVENFMSLWNSEKDFRDDYLKRSLSSIPQHTSNELDGPIRNHRDIQPISGQLITTILYRRKEDKILKGLVDPDLLMTCYRY
ncbi:proton pump-interactor 1-like isoform X2 [Papaver somniferum]|nr:proton pump-interactor 1-like isoform X2 [Papaver somniferum]